MIELSRAQRKSPVLTPSSLGCLTRAATVNVTAGCALGCIYCYARGYRHYPGDGKVRLYENLPQKLRHELAHKRRLPERVVFSPSSDLFQPIPEVLETTYELLRLLLEYGVRVSLLTKGEIPDRHLELLARHAPLVKASIGLITVDQRILDLFEPSAATARRRLDQIARLVGLGVPTEACVDPIIPGVTDDPDHLEELFSALALAGIKRVVASALFLRPAIVQGLRRHLPDREVSRRIISQYTTQSRLRVDSGLSAVRALPVEVRKEIYSRVKTLVARHGIEARLCACKNPGVTGERCRVTTAADSPNPDRQLVQLELFK